MFNVSSGSPESSPTFQNQNETILGCDCLPKIPGVMCRVADEGYHRLEQTSLPYRLSVSINLQEMENVLNLPVVTNEGDIVDISLDVSGILSVCQGINNLTTDHCDVNTLSEGCCLISRDELNGEIVRTMILAKSGDTIELHMFGIQAIDFEGSAGLYESRKSKIPISLNASVA